MPSPRFGQPKGFKVGLIKARGGHLFGLMQIPKNAKFKWFKRQKNLVHSFYYILYQPKGVPTSRDNVSGTGGTYILELFIDRKCLRLPFRKVFALGLQNLELKYVPTNLKKSHIGKMQHDCYCIQQSCPKVRTNML